VLYYQYPLEYNTLLHVFGLPVYLLNTTFSTYNRLYHFHGVINGLLYRHAFRSDLMLQIMKGKVANDNTPPNILNYE
jgi:hypothetical protein